MTEPSFAKVLEHPEYVKDLRSKAIINVDPSAINRHALRLRKMEKEQDLNIRVENLEQGLSEVKETNQQILNLLKQLTER